MIIARAVLATALALLALSPACASDNSNSTVDVNGLLAFDGTSGGNVSTGTSTGAAPAIDGYDGAGGGGSGAGISTGISSGASPAIDGFDGEGGSGAGVSTGTSSGAAAATDGFDGGGGSGPGI